MLSSHIASVFQAVVFLGTSTQEFEFLSFQFSGVTPQVHGGVERPLHR